MSKSYLSDQHTSHIEWVKELNFCADEIKTFNNRLEEVVMKNTKIEVTAQIEHFQNQFIRQKEVIDILKHDINAEENLLVENAKANNVATDHRKVEVNAKLVERMGMFTKIYNELKDEYMRFLTETM
jgi:hypothetical protein